MSAERVRSVAVLKGGRSAEREVSLSTGGQVASALAQRGFTVTEIDAADSDLIEQLAALTPDVVFICLHGRFGEDGTIQGLLEWLGLPYVGSGVLASATAMNKVVTKQLYRACGIPTPDFAAVRRGDVVDVDGLVRRLGPKTVVKPASEGSSVGMTIVHDPGELPAAIELALRHDRLVLVERFEPGTEITVAVIGNERPAALPTLEIVPQHEFYDYESKYVPGMSQHIIPARVGDEANEQARRLGVEAHVALGCAGLSRTDMIVTRDGEVTVLETNTIPGMTATSLFPDAAAAGGIPFPELCERLVDLAVEANAGRP